MKSPKQFYQDLVAKGTDLYILRSISSLVGWDQEVFMPKEGIEIHSLQKQYLEGLIHKEITSSDFQELVEKFIDMKTGVFTHVEGLEDMQKATIREWRKDIIKAKKLPDTFVKAFAKACSESVAVWAEAKKNNDFKTFAPYLENIVKLIRERASYLEYKEHPYDALLDEY